MIIIWIHFHASSSIIFNIPYIFYLKFFSSKLIFEKNSLFKSAILLKLNTPALGWKLLPEPEPDPELDFLKAELAEIMDWFIE